MDRWQNSKHLLDSLSQDHPLRSDLVQRLGTADKWGTHNLQELKQLQATTYAALTGTEPKVIPQIQEEAMEWKDWQEQQKESNAALEAGGSLLSPSPISRPQTPKIWIPSRSPSRGSSRAPSPIPTAVTGATTQGDN